MLKILITEIVNPLMMVPMMILMTHLTRSIHRHSWIPHTQDQKFSYRRRCVKERNQKPTFLQDNKTNKFLLAPLVYCFTDNSLRSSIHLFILRCRNKCKPICFASGTHSNLGVGQHQASSGCVSGN